MNYFVKDLITSNLYVYKVTFVTYQLVKKRCTQTIMAILFDKMAR